jgi:hypothetical protein
MDKNEGRRWAFGFVVSFAAVFSCLGGVSAQSEVEPALVPELADGLGTQEQANEPVLPPPPSSAETWRHANAQVGLVVPAYRLSVENQRGIDLANVPEGGTSYSYWPGLLGLIIGTGAGVGLAAFAVVAAFDNQMGLALGLLVAAPITVMLGTAAGVWLHGRRVGGYGRFGAAFGGALLGCLVTAAAMVFPPVGAIVFVTAIPLFTSWAYWKNSSQRVRRAQEAAPRFALLPTFGYDGTSFSVGAAGQF